MILKNGNIIYEDGRIEKRINIYIHNGKIEKIGDIDSELKCEIYDCTGLYITPGLVNLHAHSPMNIFKGIAEDVNINDWFNREIFPYESKLDGIDVYWGSMLAIAEMLDNGVTSFADHYFFADRICDAVLDSGIRADIAPTVFGIGEGFENQLDEVSRLIEEKKSADSRLKLRMGPHAPYTCPGDKLKIIVDRAKELGVGIHIHVSETIDQVEESVKHYGKTPFEILYDAGGFEVPAIIAHGLWILDGDLKYISRNSYFAACPKTYMKLSMGRGNIWSIFDKIPLCFGTDGAASSNTLSPLEQARLFALSGKFIADSAEKFVLEEIWKCLMRGHEALGFNTGKIAEGYDADLLVWDLNRINTAPAYNPLAAIIYSADSTNILHSMVEGKFVKKDGKVELNITEILDKVKKSQQGILERGKGKTSVNY